MIVFLDEPIERTASSAKIVVGCCIFPHNHWVRLSREAGKIGEVQQKRRLEAIEMVLEFIGGVAVVAHSNVSALDYASGEIDGTLDITEMSKTGNIWSQMMSFATCVGIACLHHYGVPLGILDVYYDATDLTASYRATCENVIRTNLPKTAKETAPSNLKRFGITRTV